MSYADHLAAARARADLSQADAAQRVSENGISVALRTWETWESGKHEPPKAKGQRVLEILRGLAKSAGSSDSPVTIPDPPADLPQPTDGRGIAVEFTGPNGVILRWVVTLEQVGAPVQIGVATPQPAHA